MAEARANRGRMKTPPEVKTQVEPLYPESERGQGHTSSATVRGVLGIDGRMTEATISRSTGSAVLDDAALVAAKATLFTPAADAQGAPISVVMAYTVELSPPQPRRPAYVKRVEAAYPDSERLAGHFGQVIIAGKLGADGRLADAVVKTSSRAPALDAIALEAAKASQFQPYRDSAGAVVPTAVEVPFSFDSIHTPGQGGGVLRYRCAQFALDETWWRSVWADKPSELKSMLLGLRSLVWFRQPGDTEPKAFKAMIADYDTRWAAAVETCRTRPDALMIDVLKPEGDWARSLAERAR